MWTVITGWVLSSSSSSRQLLRTTASIRVVNEPFCTLQVGLDTLALFCKKKSYGTRINNKLYCSEITKQFVLRKYPLFPEKVGIYPDFLDFPRQFKEVHCTLCGWYRVTFPIFEVELQKSPGVYKIIPAQAIVALQLNEARTIHVYDSRDIYKLRTTAIPSHHCPGSVMLLFERLDDEVDLETV